MDNEKRGLRERRRELGMTLGDIGRKSLIGIVDLSAFERGLRHPNEYEADRLARALRWTKDELKASLPSAKEIDQACDSHSQHLIAAIRAVRAEADRRGLGKGHGGSGSIECPVCRGPLSFTVAALNGHVWGAGDVETCVRWMQ